MGQTLLAQLENLAFKLQFYYMRKKITRERVSPHYAFFHPRPTAQTVLSQYRRKLRYLRGVVLVTGCFDILHQEHIKFLRAAKKQGDQLLVGLETDARVRQLKGPGRPINSLQLRLTNLKQLGIVDKVFALPKKFSTSADYLTFLRKIKPDILAVSSSTPHLKIKRHLLKTINAKLKIVLPHNPKISSSKMLILPQ